jgi:peroxiredoxin/uncharacterized membrane protein YphA (DoxX/SURF4 family)
VLLLARLLLAAAFLPAGVSKLHYRQRSRQSLVDFGVPKPLAFPTSILLAIGEVLLAMGLVIASVAWISAIAATALLIVFIYAIGINLALGRKPECNCFGQLYSRPITWSLAARNGLLASFAVFVISAGPKQPSFLNAIRNTATARDPVFLAIAVAALALLIVQSFVLYRLVQQGGRILLRLDAMEEQLGSGAPTDPAPLPGLPVGYPAPAFELPDLDGTPISLDRLRAGGKPVILVFTHPTCGPCAAFLPEAVAWQRDSYAHFNLVLISQGDAASNRATLKDHSIHSVLLQRENEISEQYDALGTPSAVLIRPDGMVGSPVAIGAEAIRSLISNTINESVAGLVAIQLSEGSTVPPLVFPDLDGRMFNLSELRGKPAILLFWNPGCGYCQRMSDDLKSWEKKAAKTGTHVLLISRGAVDENRKQSFRSPILLDQNFSAGKAFGVAGTPSGVLVDNEARIASKVAVGRQEIFGIIFSPQFDSAARTQSS